jgi:cysteine desulfurase/selenocysteine lyase
VRAIQRVFHPDEFYQPELLGLAGQGCHFFSFLLDKMAKVGEESGVIDFSAVRDDFPILSRRVDGVPLIYFDNAATTQKPTAVLDASRNYYERMNSNIHRGTHRLAREATEAFEAAREKVASFIGATDARSVIFTGGATDSLNLAAQTLSSQLSPGDEVLLSTLEHHSNIVPWQLACERTGAQLRVIPCDDAGVLPPSLAPYLTEKTKIVALTWISNAFGTVNPVSRYTAEAKQHGVTVVIDASQAAPHFPINVAELGCDMIAFSGHKMYATTGIGVLWGRYELLAALPPYRGGGEMIKEVRFEATTYNEPPFRFEAGTPNIEGAIALAAACDYLNGIGRHEIHEHESSLMRAAETELSSISGIHLYGPADRCGALSFAVAGVHAYDLGTFLDQMGVAVRTGHHCCQPLMQRFGITGTTRASFALYNTHEEVARFGESMRRAVNLLR